MPGHWMLSAMNEVDVPSIGEAILTPTEICIICMTDLKLNLWKETRVV